MIGENLIVKKLLLILIKLIGSEKSDVNFSMNQYLSEIDSLLGTHAPLKKLNKKELKFLTKLWVTQGLQNSIKKKSNTYSKCLKCKNQSISQNPLHPL